MLSGRGQADFACQTLLRCYTPAYSSRRVRVYVRCDES